MLTNKIKSLLGIQTNPKRAYELVFLSYLAFFVINVSIYLWFSFTKIQAQSHLLTLLAIGVVYLVYLRTDSYRMCAHAILALNYVHVTFNALCTGGVHSPAVACLTFMPTAALMLGRRSAYVWLGMSMLCISALAAVNARFPEIQNFHMASENAFWSVLMQMSMSVALLMTVWLFEIINEQRILELEQKTHEQTLTYQALLAAQAHKDEFIASVGHELRTPMNAILGFTDLLSHEVKSSKAQQTIRHIQTSAKQLLRVVSHILDYSQLMAHKLHLSLKQTHPASLIQETISAIQYQHQEKPIEIVFTARPQAPQTALIDTFRIKQVLEHLLTNAIKFMEQGRIEVTLSGDDHWLRVEVSDNGIGISEEKQKSIFKHFEHASREINRRYGGTGLGLTICDHLIRLHHGHIGVQSELGFGSTFWFEIPTNPYHPDHQQDSPSPTNVIAASTTFWDHALIKPWMQTGHWFVQKLDAVIPQSPNYPQGSRAKAKLQLLVGACIPAPLYFFYSTDIRLAIIFAIYPVAYMAAIALIIGQFHFKFMVHTMLAIACCIFLSMSLFLGGSHGLMNWTSLLPLPAFNLLGEAAGLTWLGISFMAQWTMLFLTTQHALPIPAESVLQPIVLFWVGNLHMTLLSLHLPLHYKKIAHRVRHAIRLKHLNLEKIQHELLQAQKIKDDFIASVSHEFRTPMNAIMGFNYLLSEQIKDNPESLALQAHVTQSAEHLLTVIDDIFDYSELQHGILHIRKDPFDIQQVFQNAYGMFFSKVSKIDFKLHLTDLPQWVIGDSHRLMQILVNLIGNALKFTHHGYVHIDAKSSHGGVQFKVYDSGVGIARDKINLIFSQYEQAHKEGAKLGHGLGLAICKRLIEQQNGTIEVDSRPQMGSCFTVWLPYPICPPALEIVSEKIMEATVQQQLKILVVDDHPLNRLLARQMLERTWPQALMEEAEDGAKAIQKVRHNHFDIIIMDMVMPEMDGIEATTMIRTSVEEDKRHTPILGLTANINPIDKERCLQAGMNDIIYKPFNKDDLIRCIIKLVNQPQALVMDAA